MKRKRFTLIELLVAISLFAALMIVCSKWNWKSYSPEYKCRLNLLLLYGAMQRYTNDYVQYPTPNKWCDLIVENTGQTPPSFCCPATKHKTHHITSEPIEKMNLPKDMIFVTEFNNVVQERRYLYLIKRSHYAMNPNCSPNSPPDIVLLFETEDGWNQFGGPELLTTKHHKGKGCNILFNDGRFEFVKKEQLGNLNWGDEQKQ